MQTSWWVALALVLLSQPAFSAAPKPPDLSGFWMLNSAAKPDADMMKQVKANTVWVNDTGALELPQGNFGGLKLTAAALAAAKKWDPREELKMENACRAPSIVYALQGPFPIEIFQATELIVMKLEYYDLVRIIFLDGRKPEADYPHSKVGFSVGRWEGDTLVVETTHLEAATITNNGLSHSNDVRVTERFKLSADGQSLLATQAFEDPAVLDNAGVRFISWKKQAGQHVFPYDCDPNFAGNYAR